MTSKVPNEGECFDPWRRYDVQRAILASPQLSMGAKVTWACLMAEVSDEHESNREAGRVGSVEASYEKIASLVGVETKQAIAYLRQLSTAHLIQTQPWEGGKNHYFFRWRDLKSLTENKPLKKIMA